MSVLTHEPEQRYLVYEIDPKLSVVICDSETGRVYNPHRNGFTRPTSPDVIKYFGPFKPENLIYFEFAFGAKNTQIDLEINRLPSERQKIVRMALAYFENDRIGCFDLTLQHHADEERKERKRLAPYAAVQTIIAVQPSWAGTGGTAPEYSMLSPFTEKNAARLLSDPRDRLSQRNKTGPVPT